MPLGSHGDGGIMFVGGKNDGSMGGRTLSKTRTRQFQEGRGDKGFGAITPSELPAIWQIFGDEGIAQRLLLLAKMIERVTSRKLQDEFGISVAQWRVLAFVCISGPSTATFIGGSAEVDPAEVSRAVKSLMDRQLITREFEPGSRKSMVIGPTACGRDLFADIRRQRREYFSRVTNGLPPSAKARLNRSLTSMARHVVAERSESEAIAGAAKRRND